MGSPPLDPSVADQDEGAGFLDLDIEDLVIEIMDKHPHLLNQQDESMEHLAPHKSAMPSAPAAVIHAGPAAAKPVTHTPSAPRGQNLGSSSPPPLTRLLESRAVRPIFFHQPTSRQDIQKSSAYKHPVSPRQYTPYKESVPYEDPTNQEESTSHKQAAPHKSGTGRRSRQRYRSRRGSALHDHDLIREGSEQGIQEHQDGLEQKISDLSLREQYHIQQAVGDRACRHRSSFVGASQRVRRAEHVDGCSPRHGSSPHADVADVHSSSRKAYKCLESAPAGDLVRQPELTSYHEWEGEDDEDEYEQVSASRAKRACNDNEPEISTYQDLKHTSLVWAESGAKMLYLCGKKIYEVMWTSPTSQNLRRSAMHTTQSASGQAADGLTKLVLCKCRPTFGSVKNHVSHRCNALSAVRWSPRDAARWSVIRAVRLSHMRMFKVAAPILGLLDETPESDIEDNWDLCEDAEDAESNNTVVSSADNYGDEGRDAPGLFMDDDGDYQVSFERICDDR